MNLNEVIFIENLPTIDLHGLDRDTARVYVEDFIHDNVKMKNKIIVIVHGIGSRILLKETHQVLKHHKRVKAYKIFLYNPGCTIAELQFDK